MSPFYMSGFRSLLLALCTVVSKTFFQLKRSSYLAAYLVQLNAITAVIMAEAERPKNMRRTEEAKKGKKERKNDAERR